MSKGENGGSAFPSEQHETQDGTWNQTYNPGMSLRDWFAGQALVGMGMWMPSGSFGDLGKGDIERRALWAYQQADAMLAERSK